LASTDPRPAVHDFLRYAFGVDPPFEPGEERFVSGGWYLERYPEKVFLLEVEGARVIAARERPRGLDRLLGSLKPDFDDTDWFLSSAIGFSERELGESLVRAHAPLLAQFYSHCREEEKDNVDLTLGQDSAWGCFWGGELTGFARYYGVPPDFRIADLGVIVRPDQRGKGLAKKLVARACWEAMRAGLIPRYRTNVDNHATIAVARALGFEPFYRFRSYPAEALGV
jgi:GNAT superfamily N-acetyltransferase